MAAQERGPKRAVDLLVDFVDLVFPERLGPHGAAHVVHGNVDASVGSQSLIHHSLGALGGFEVGVQRDRLTTFGCDSLA